MLRLLSFLGYRIEFFGSAEEFLNHEITDPAINACVISEMRLPGVSGLSLLKRLRRRGGDLPVIILADDPDVSSAVAALHLRVSDYMVKPIVDRDLANRLRAVFKRTPGFAYRQNAG